MIAKACIKLSVAAVLCAGVLAPVTASAGATSLTLINGWHNYDSSTNKPAITAIKGVAYLKGAIATSGTNDQPFVLPAAFRPAARVYTKIDLCDAHNGRLDISTDGTVHVEVGDGDFSHAQCFTSLEGASFALSNGGYKAVKLKNGWQTTIYGTATPAANSTSGIVSLEGAMSSSKTSTTAFILSAKLRPSARVYVPADMFGATNGRLIIDTDGTVTVDHETDGQFALDFTSLDGVSFAISNAGFTPISLTNGWAPYPTRNPAVRLSGKLVQFQGAIASGTNALAFVLPSSMRPSKTIYVPVDLCNATNGRLEIDSDGSAYVEPEGDFSNAQCFTSLEGVSFLH